MQGLNDCDYNKTDKDEPQKPKEWSYIGVGRDDGKRRGEFSPIFYRPTVYKLLYFKNIWLSETPDSPSMGWDAACPRILTIGIFRHRATHKMIVALNTHLDHVGVVARLESAKLILAELEHTLKITGRMEGEARGLDWARKNVAVFLAGDFNSEPEQEAYQVLNGEISPVQDFRGMVHPMKRYGHENTFTGFEPSEKPTRIDFLFVGREQRWEGKMYSVLESRFEDGVYASDHRAVVGDAVLLPEPGSVRKVVEAWVDSEVEQGA
jgi:endonuclease/exonuclease/phosphatase family metal-dependent hydrolase